MASVNRTAVLDQAPQGSEEALPTGQPPPPGRSLLENLLFACCLENAPLRHGRAGVPSRLDRVLRLERSPRQHGQGTGGSDEDAARTRTAAANGLKRALQGVFEANYSFDLEA